ncbi:MAG: uroporphyrinogen-III C-methyltransferase [Nitrospirota bacterium]|nr:uroporphyrinogen-III C-methyltransferase [Nitrospirota bacterium]
MKSGKVYLIGAGPGDPKLITLRAVECIKAADVLIYDYLANKKFLEYGKPGAEIIYVGKMGGEHTLPQDKINDLIVEKARSGKTVARLKGGDPYIFGRGGEEAEELVEAGVAFEVVPGVTAAAAATAYAGIPLTHRSFTTDVALITGHEDPTKTESSIKWDKIATGIGTLVFYMGVSNLPNIVENLIRYGRDPKTPVALIRWGSTTQQETLVGTLEDIVEKVKKAGMKAPAITVVGGVVSLREKLRWFDKRPLFGKKVIVTRARVQSSDFTELLEANGASVVEFPTIDIVPPDDWTELDKAIDRLSDYQWVIFTSVNGVKYFLQRLRERGRDVRDLKGIRLCTIGPRTAEEVEKLGIRVDFVPSEYKAEGIIEGLGKESLKGQKILIPRAEVAREVLPEELKRLGAVVDVVDTYKTVRPVGDVEKVKQLFADGKVDAVTFTSSSTVENFVSMFPDTDIKALLNGVTVASIGPITKETAEKLGIRTDIMPKDYTIPALTEALVDHFSRTVGV